MNCWRTFETGFSLSGFRGIFSVIAVGRRVGCSGGVPTGAVTGTVTLDGEPLENAMVTFTPVGGGRSTVGTTDASGKYTLSFRGESGALLGEHKVSITSIPETQSDFDSEASSDSDAYTRQATGGGAADYNSASTKEVIPEKYNTSTTLTASVQSGDNVFNFDLESE